MPSGGRRGRLLVARSAVDRRLGLVVRLLDSEQLCELARLVHLGDDVATADELAVDEELRDRRPSEIAESSWRIRGSGRMSSAAYFTFSELSAAEVRIEKPHAG